VLLAAPTGSGKTICAEFAILRMLQVGTRGGLRDRERGVQVVVNRGTLQVGERGEGDILTKAGGRAHAAGVMRPGGGGGVQLHRVLVGS
jgi:hypothetical protein